MVVRSTGSAPGHRTRTSEPGSPPGAEPARHLESLLSTSTWIAYARFASDGALVSANARFLAISEAREGTSLLPELVVEGQRREMAGLLGGTDLPEEPRHVHFAVATRAPTTLIVTWTREGEELVLIGEPPFSDLEATQATLVSLNGRVADLARENSKKSAQLERALDDLRHAQSMLVHREKMAALGQVTAGVAHELNNPLSYVKNNVYLLGRGVEAILDVVNLMGDGLDAIEASQPALYEAIMTRMAEADLVHLAESLPEIAASADAGVERAAQLVDSLRTFSRLDEAEVKAIDLNESLQAVVEFAGFLLRKTDTTFVSDFGELPPVTCAPGQLNQAVLNILTNAIQASAPGGAVGLATRTDGAEVTITITDDGPGVPDDIADRIFDPFFTTRPVGEGTGLGLSIAHTVVVAHGGRITLGGAGKAGTVFTIHLPIDGVLPE